MRSNEDKCSLTDEYLNEVGENIRWKKARRPLLAELRAHIDESREDMLRHGLTENEAEKKAVAEMGSAEETGMALDRIHRPQPDWMIIGGAAALMLLGIVLYAGFGVPSEMVTKMAVYSCISVIFMLVGYFCDYTLLGRAPFTVCFGMSAVCAITGLAGLRTTAAQLCYILPLTFAAVVWKERGCSTKGVLTLYAAEAACIAVPLVVIASAPLVVYVLAACTSVFVYAAVNGWFSLPKCRAAIFALLPTAVVVAAWALIFCRTDHQRTRLLAAFTPEKYADSYGFLSVAVKELVGNSVFVGRGGESEHLGNYAFFRTFSDPFTSNYFLATASNRYGWIVPAIVAAVVVFITAAIIRAAKRQSCRLGSVVILAVGVSFALRTVCYFACNLGFMLLELDGLPLFSSCGKLAVIDAFMLGLLLSVFRNGSISRDSEIKTVRILQNKA